MFGRVIVGLIAVVSPLLSQTFDVASIKPTAEGEKQGLTIDPGGRLVATGFNLKVLVALAHHLQAYQLAGGDSWIGSDRWNIVAKADDVKQIPAWAAPVLPEVIAMRLRRLLDDRFSLKTHRESRTMPVYVLAAGRGGSKLVFGETPSGQGTMRAGPGVVIGTGATMDQIVTYLNRLMDKPVIDRTGLTGTYNFKLQFDPESTRKAMTASQDLESTLSAPTIFQALLDQMGLKLEAAKEAVEVTVIDSAKKPVVE